MSEHDEGGRRGTLPAAVEGFGGVAGRAVPDALDLPRRPLRPHRLRADADGERGAAELRRNRSVNKAASSIMHSLALARSLARPTPLLRPIPLPFRRSS